MDGLHMEYAFYGLLTVESFDILVHVEKTDALWTPSRYLCFSDKARVQHRQLIIGEGFSISNLGKSSRERCLLLSHHLE